MAGVPTGVEMKPAAVAILKCRAAEAGLANVAAHLGGWVAACLGGLPGMAGEESVDAQEGGAQGGDAQEVVHRGVMSRRVVHREVMRWRVVHRGAGQPMFWQAGAAYCAGGASADHIQG